MDAKQAIVANLGQSDFIVEGYLADLTPEQMLTRPNAGCNHIAWQVGHLISSERYLVDKIAPGSMEPLPAGFDEKHKKAAAGTDDKGAFLSKDEYLKLRKQVRAGALKVLEKLSPADLDKPAPAGVPPFIKTVGDLFVFLPTHWVMHAGQWAVIRRHCGKPALF